MTTLYRTSLRPHPTLPAPGGDFATNRVIDVAMRLPSITHRGREPGMQGVTLKDSVKIARAKSNRRTPGTAEKGDSQQAQNGDCRRPARYRIDSPATSSSSA